MKAAQLSSTSLTVPAPLKQGLVSSACAHLDAAGEKTSAAKAA
jgi:hypothetical protein